MVPTPAPPSEALRSNLKIGDSSPPYGALSPITFPGGCAVSRSAGPSIPTYQDHQPKHLKLTAKCEEPGLPTDPRSTTTGTEGAGAQQYTGYGFGTCACGRTSLYRLGFDDWFNERFAQIPETKSTEHATDRGPDYTTLVLLHASLLFRCPAIAVVRSSFSPLPF